METYDSTLIKSTDLRKSIGIAAATFSGLLKDKKITTIKGTARKGAYILSKDARTILKSRGLKFPRTAQTICFGVSKGGVGKTSCSFFTALRMADYGAKVLLIDADGQGNLTESFTKQIKEMDITIDEDLPILSDVVKKSKPLKPEEVIIPINENIHLIPSTPVNQMLETDIVTGNVTSRSLHKVFKNLFTPELKKEYDYIIIDSAPAINSTNSALFLMSNKIILPINPDAYSVISLRQTLETINNLKQDFKEIKWKPELNILLTKYDSRERSSLRVLAALMESYEDLILQTVIRNSDHVRSAIFEERNLFEKSSAPMEDFDDLVKEIMNFKSINKKLKSN